MGETVGVFAEPEQLVLNVTKDDRFIVIASDGVFEFITSLQVSGRYNLLPLGRAINVAAKQKKHTPCLLSTECRAHRKCLGMAVDDVVVYF